MARRSLFAALILCAASLSGCASVGNAIEEANAPPDMAPMQDPRALYAYQPVMMPMPVESRAAPAYANSLWRAGARSFFDDPRASKVGDILTVQIDVDDQASVTNSTSRSRTSSQENGVDAFLGLENSVGRVLPGGFNPATAIDVDSASNLNGAGTVDRSESIQLTVAAIVTQTLPNGNLVIAGRQEVRINHEVRELLISGVVRPEDITGGNTIVHTKIAEARISYGGRGVISSAQGARWGQKGVEAVWPF